MVPVVVINSCVKGHPHFTKYVYLLVYLLLSVYWFIVLCNNIVSLHNQIMALAKYYSRHNNVSAFILVTQNALFVLAVCHVCVSGHVMVV